MAEKNRPKKKDNKMKNSKNEISVKEEIKKEVLEIVNQNDEDKILVIDLMISDSIEEMKKELKAELIKELKVVDKKEVISTESKKGSVMYPNENKSSKIFLLQRQIYRSTTSSVRNCVNKIEELCVEINSVRNELNGRVSESRSIELNEKLEDLKLNLNKALSLREEKIKELKAEIKIMKSDRFKSRMNNCLAKYSV